MDEFWIDATLNTAVIVIAVMSFSFFLAIPMAWLVERSNLPGRNFFRSFLTLPYIIPSYLLAVSWITLANPDVGWINTWAQSLGLKTPLVNIYGLAGIIFVESTAIFAILYLSFRAALARMDTSLEEAARMSGAGPLQVFLKITLPLLRTNIFLGLISVGLASMASFGVPAMIGTPGRRFVLTTGIYSLFQNGTAESFQQAVKVSLAVVAVTLVLVALSRALARQKASFLGAKTSRPALVDLGRWKYIITASMSVLFFITLGLPLITLVFSSFQSDPSRFDLASLSIQYWERVINLNDFHSGLVNSVISSLVAAIGISILALLFSIAKWKAQFSKSKRLHVPLRLIEEISFAFYSTPGTVLALLLIVSFRSLGLFSLADTVLALIIAYGLKYLSLGLSTTTPSALLVHPSLIEAAQLSGATRIARIQHIWLPLLKPSLIASFLLVLMPCLGELTMSKLLSAPKTQNLGVVIFELQEYADRASAAVVGTILLVFVSLLQIFIGRLNRES